MKMQNKLFFGKMKAIFAAVLAVLCAAAFASCSANGSGDKEATDNANPSTETKLSIVCTAFPQYDWVRVIAGERADKFDIKLLSGKGTDMHSYQPTAEDMKNIAASAMFVYVGGVSEKWVEDVKKSAGADKTVFLNLTESLGDTHLEEETALEPEDDHDHGDDSGYDDEDGHDHDHGEVEYDEHIWLSVKNAQRLVAAVAAELAKLDADGKDVYENNLKEYLLKLSALDAEYKKAAENGKRDTVIFADRFPFLYLMKDYGIKYHAAFAGCSAESEASFKTIKALGEAADEIKTDTVLVTETSDGAVADAVISGMTVKGCTKAVMNSMQSVKTAEAEKESYLGIMQANLETLKKALG